jgi:hypothetical protein
MLAGNEHFSLFWLNNSDKDKSCYSIKWRPHRKGLKMKISCHEKLWNLSVMKLVNIFFYYSYWLCLSVFWRRSLKWSEAKFTSLHLDLTFWQCLKDSIMVMWGLTCKIGNRNFQPLCTFCLFQSSSQNLLAPSYDQYSGTCTLKLFTVVIYGFS